MPLGACTPKKGEALFPVPTIDRRQQAYSAQLFLVCATGANSWVCPSGWGTDFISIRTYGDGRMECARLLDFSSSLTSLTKTQRGEALSGTGLLARPAPSVGRC